MILDNRLAVVLPCYKSRDKVIEVIKAIGPEVDIVIAVDDCCPQKTGKRIEEDANDPRVIVLYNDRNMGVGGAVIRGYKKVIELGADIAVKIDSDGQMNPALVPMMVNPIVVGLADYTKGNRFHNLDDLRGMPALRAIGNAALSFLTKMSSGYWTIFDPTNGYTAIHRLVLERLPLDKVDHTFFFESDMLFRLYNIGAVVQDVPAAAIYADEVSNLKISRILGSFLLKNIRNALKRIGYRYFLRDFNIASLELLLGISFVLFGLIFGVSQWIAAAGVGITASPGTVMLAGLPTLAGLQLMLGFLAFDFAAVPKVAVVALLGDFSDKQRTSRRDSALNGVWRS